VELAGDVTIWSKPQATKSANCISQIGRMPTIAADRAPDDHLSEIGVSMTRSGRTRRAAGVTLNARPSRRCPPE